MKLDFTNKHIVVTGGTGALGSAVTKKLLDYGVKVSIPCFKESELDDFEFKNHQNIWVQAGLDLTNETATKRFYEEAVEVHGGLWASVNIAGGFAMGTVENSSKQDFMTQLNLNLITCFNSCKASLPHLKTNGGRIVNISSRPGIEPKKGADRTPYAVSKAGVAALTQSLAAEVLDDDILVNAIAPSIIDTPQNRQAMPNADYTKWPKPEEIANEILYLISEENKLTNGVIIPVYGKG